MNLFYTKNLTELERILQYFINIIYSDKKVTISLLRINLESFIKFCALILRRLLQ